MSIDARIISVRRRADRTDLVLEPRQQAAIAGRRQLSITKNPDYEPQVGDKIWGNAHQCMIGRHEFRRIMLLWDGTRQVL